MQNLFLNFWLDLNVLRLIYTEDLNGRIPSQRLDSITTCKTIGRVLKTTSYSPPHTEVFCKTCQLGTARSIFKIRGLYPNGISHVRLSCASTRSAASNNILHNDVDSFLSSTISRSVTYQSYRDHRQRAFLTYRILTQAISFYRTFQDQHHIFSK